MHEEKFEDQLQKSKKRVVVSSGISGYKIKQTWQPRIAAASLGHASLVHELLKANAEVNAPNQNGATDLKIDPRFSFHDLKPWLKCAPVPIADIIYKSH